MLKNALHATTQWCWIPQHGLVHAVELSCWLDKVDKVGLEHPASGTRHRLWLSDWLWLWYIIYHISYLVYHISYIMYHASCNMYYVSSIMYHVSYLLQLLWLLCTHPGTEVVWSEVIQWYNVMSRTSKSILVTAPALHSLWMKSFLVHTENNRYCGSTAGASLWWPKQCFTT